MDLIGPQQNSENPVITGSNASSWPPVVVDRLGEDKIDPDLLTAFHELVKLPPGARAAFVAVVRLLLDNRSESR
jgi:hypothetical protein